MIILSLFRSFAARRASRPLSGGIRSSGRLAILAVLGALVPSGGVHAAEGDPRPLFRSPVVTAETPDHAVAVEVGFAENRPKQVHLVATDGGDGFACDWADWAEPRFVLEDGSEVRLTDLKWKSATSDWGQVRIDANAGGGPLRIDGEPVAHGIGTHANSVIVYDVPENAVKFVARAGLDNGGTDQNGGGASSVQFFVFDGPPPRALVAASGGSGSGGGGGASHEPAEAVSQLDVHPDLLATLFASEPMVLSPAAIDVDHRGRVWVCEVVNYRGNQGKRPEGDRILILEDTDGDAVADSAKVFHQGSEVDSAHGICVLGNRVIVSAGDDVLQFFDDDADDVADRREVLFTRIGGAQHDHGIHAFRFGPDGKLYFNFGNAGRQLCDRDGNLIVDLAGNEVTVQNNPPYRQGMIFRCDLDGSNVETLAWNFRNNWEACVDSFGRIWQSDNDDDGNRGVRINYVMEFGNYGFVDEISGAGWGSPRPGMHEEIPLRHWHLNDPGVVPNLLQTGAGSPTGITVYEGTLLPPVFRGAVLHCDAGPNVVRAYVPSPDGAGFTAETVDILTGTRNRWFRPSDVCVAPDGSLIVADWYDPGVGGHGMGDIERGRIFRVVPGDGDHGARYRIPETNIGSVEGAIQALCSPNESARYLGWQRLVELGETARPVLNRLARANGEPAHLRARARWLLARLDPEAMTQPDPSEEEVLQDTAVRIAKSVYREQPEALLASLEAAIRSASPAVRREAAIALRFHSSEAADRIWAELAVLLDAGDRWMLEALGIGAELSWEKRMAAFRSLPRGEDAVSPAYREILWRSRTRDGADEMAARAVAASNADDELTAIRFLRAIHFQPDRDRAAAALETIVREAAPPVAVAAALELDPGRAAASGDLRSRLDRLADQLGESAEAVALVTRHRLPDREPLLLGAIAANPGSDQAAAAARALLDAESTVLQDALQSDESAGAAATAVARTGDRRGIGLLVEALDVEGAPLERRRAVATALAMSGAGEEALLNLAREGRLAGDLDITVGALLGRSRDAGIRQAVAEVLDLPPVIGAADLPPIGRLVTMRGAASRGKTAFTKGTCQTCHVVAGEGLAFGPDLSQIGAKLSREALFESILYPNNAVSHGFHAAQLSLASGEVVIGIPSSETGQSITVLLPAGISRAIPTAEIAERKPIDVSLMPEGLAGLLEAQEVVDLVSYLESLR